MVSAPPIQLVVFDLGGVLIRIASGWEEACERAGHDPAEFVQMTKPSKPGIELDLQDLWKAHDTGKMSSPEVYAQAGKLLDIAPDIIRKVFAAWLIGPYPGVPELLTELQSRQINTACLSNTNPHHWQIVNTPDGPATLPLDRLTHRFASQLIGYANLPRPLSLMSKLKPGVPREQILFLMICNPT
ncbi:MAG: hypothetical protein HC898_11135 [Phycisphaerales bacterium]|nr:hypothetical protein [Phycisphaerales bacterium]